MAWVTLGAEFGKEYLPDTDAQGRCGLMPEPAWEVEIRLYGSWGKVLLAPTTNSGWPQEKVGLVWPHILYALTLRREVVTRVWEREGWAVGA